MNVEVKRRWAGEEVDQRAPTASFLDALSELMEGDDRVVVLVSDDVEFAGIGNLSSEHGERILNGGSAERNLIGMATGLAAVGKVPVILMTGITASLTVGRELLLGAAHSGLHLVLVGLPGGLDARNGAAGHALSDLAVLGAMPGFRVLVPTDAEETAKALITLVDEPGPGYLRLAVEPRPVITGPDSAFDFGRAALWREGDALTLVATGDMVYEALVASDLLEDQGTSARVLALHTIQPFDGEAIDVAARETGALVVIEEHAPVGGLGARIARQVAGSQPVPMEHLHAGETFVGAASNEELRTTLGLTAASIVEAAQRVLARKG